MLILPSMAEAATADPGTGTVLSMRRDTALAQNFPAATAVYSVITEAGTQKITGIDFAKEEILVASMGMQLTGGSSITFAEIREFDDRVVAYVKATSPGMDGAHTQTITCPSDTVIIAKTSKPVYFSVESFEGTKSTGTSLTYPILTALQGPTTKVAKTETLVIKDGKAWEAMWKDQIGSETAPNNTVKNSMAVAVLLGPDKAGKNVAITSIAEIDKVIEVTYTLSPIAGVKPKNGILNLGGNNNPNPQPVDPATLVPIAYAVAVIPASTLEVKFVQQDLTVPVAIPGALIGPPGVLELK